MKPIDLPLTKLFSRNRRRLKYVIVFAAILSLLTIFYYIRISNESNENISFKKEYNTPLRNDGTPAIGQAKINIILK